MDAYNDFDHQTDIAIQPLTGIAVTADGIGCTLPPCSVAELTLAL